MDKQTAIKRMAELVKQGKTVFDLTFKEPCVEFFLEEIQEIQLSENDIHFKTFPAGEIVDYKKEFIMALGMAAGISVSDTIHSKESMFIHNSVCFVRRMTPNGTAQELSADGCYDVEARFEIELANDIIKYEKWVSSGKNGKQEGGKYSTGNPRLDEALQRKRKAEMAQHGAQQADTNAHERAIKKMLCIPPATTKINGAYIIPRAVMFVSCIKPNLENQEIRAGLLNNFFGRQNVSRLQQPAEQKELPPPVNADDKNTIKSDITFGVDDDANAGWEDVTDSQIDHVSEIEAMLNSDFIQRYTMKDAMFTAAKNIISGKDQALINVCHAALKSFLSDQTDAGKNNRAGALLNILLYHPAIQSFKLDDIPYKHIIGAVVDKFNAGHGNPQEVAAKVKECRSIIEKGGKA